MLKRMALRRYLLALLWHDTVPQGPECETGYLWTNCGGERADVFDHETHQLFENAEDGYDLGNESVAIVFGFERVSYQLWPARAGDTRLSVWIDIVCRDRSGQRRQDILDQVEERVLFRLLSYQTFTDASTGETLTSPLRRSQNGLEIDSQDDSSFAGDHTIRRLKFTLGDKDCILRPGCEDEPLCFDFAALIPPEGIC